MKKKVIGRKAGGFVNLTVTLSERAAFPVDLTGLSDSDLQATYKKTVLAYH